MSLRQDVEMVQSWAVPAQTLAYAFRHLPRKPWTWPLYAAGLFVAGVLLGLAATGELIDSNLHEF